MQSKRHCGSVMEFEQIYTTYFKAVFLYVMQLSGDEHIAEDITSETLEGKETFLPGADPQGISPRVLAGRILMSGYCRYRQGISGPLRRRTGQSRAGQHFRIKSLCEFALLS